METSTSGLPATHSSLAEVIDLGNTVLKLDSITQARLATVPTGGIAELIGLLDNFGNRIKAAQAEVQKTLTGRFAERARLQLLADGRDTGTTHIQDDEFDITVEIGKDVKWDQTKLPAIWDRIAASGDDPRQYIEVKYSVSETKFKAWPQTLRAPFDALRTVTPKAPKFVLRRQEGGAA